jgi:hypothetical protein
MHGANVVFLPSHVAVKRVYADVQNLGIKRGELLAVAIERRQLFGSSRRPVEGMKGYNHVLLPTKITKPNPDTLLPLHRRQLKVRGDVSNVQRHISPVTAFYNVVYKH